MSNFAFQGAETQANKQTKLPQQPNNNFRSPVLCSSLQVPESIDRELIRSVYLFGAEDSFRESSRRIPSFKSLNSTAKRAIRDRRLYLLKLKEDDPEKLDFLLQQYSIPSELQRQLTLDFDKEIKSPVETKRTTMEYALKPFMKQYGKTFESLIYLFILSVNTFLQ